MLEISNVKNDKNNIELDFLGLETGVKKHLKCNTENYKQICNYIGSNLNNDEFQYLVNFLKIILFIRIAILFIIMNLVSYQIELFL